MEGPDRISLLPSLLQGKLIRSSRTSMIDMSSKYF
jgi:hypothetical protein